MKNTKQKSKVSVRKKQQTGENVQILKKTQSGVLLSSRYVNFFSSFEGDGGYDDVDENGDDDVDDGNGDDGGIM